MRDLLRKRAQLVRCRTAQALSIQNLVARNTGQGIKMGGIRELDNRSIATFAAGTRTGRCAALIRRRHGDTLKAGGVMIRKLRSGEYRIYSRSVDPRTHKRRNLGTFQTRHEAAKHEREIQYFKKH